MKVAEPDEAYDPDNEDPEEVTFNCFALENAVRRNMSIWRSHGMTGERRKYSTSEDEDEEEEELEEDDDSVADGVHSSAAETANDADDDDWCCAEPSGTTGICAFL